MAKEFPPFQTTLREINIDFGHYIVKIFYIDTVFSDID